MLRVDDRVSNLDVEQMAEGSNLPGFLKNVKVEL